MRQVLPQETLLFCLHANTWSSVEIFGHLCILYQVPVPLREELSLQMKNLFRKRKMLSLMQIWGKYNLPSLKNRLLTLMKSALSASTGELAGG